MGINRRHAFCQIGQESFWQLVGTEQFTIGKQEACAKQLGGQVDDPGSANSDGRNVAYDINMKPFFVDNDTFDSSDGATHPLRDPCPFERRACCG